MFLANNNLPEGWGRGDRFVIAETGFGTGLNFLAAWTLFEETARASQTLHFISFEQYPLAWREIEAALSPWKSVFGDRLQRLRALYPLRVPGFHRLVVNARVMLTLIFDDVNDALPQLDVPGGVDVWFLDGFAPAKNPGMWTEAVFTQMARLSRPGTSFATFTAAGAVKRGLQQAGFAVEKRAGFGRKRDMLAGVFRGSDLPAQPVSRRQRIAIIGGGLAGTAASFVLRRRGYDVVIFEKSDHLASGASGNALGLFNPRLSAQRTPESDFYTAAFAQVVRTLRELQETADISYRPCGSLHLVTDSDKKKRLQSACVHWGWHEDHMRYLTAEETSICAGVTLPLPALHLPDAGTVSPAALCRAYAVGSNVRTGIQAMPEKSATGWRVGDEEFDAVILACGAAVKSFDATSWLPVNTVRGQVTGVRATAATKALRTNLCYGGYLSPAIDGIHMTGATFQKWLEDDALRPEDDVDNLAAARKILPDSALSDVVSARAALRTASRDRFPIVGSVPDVPSLYLSTAHGSHGIISTLAAAHVLADIIGGDAASLSRATLKILSPARFRRGD